MAETVNENVYDLLKDDPTRIYVIAEAGLNHGGSKERALALVRAAKWAGADAVEFETFPAERLASARPAVLGQTPNQPNSQELLKTLELPCDAFRALTREAKRLNIGFLSSPFDEESADFLEELRVSAFKIAAGDITHRPLIEHIGRKGKPVLLSTEMGTGDEIGKAIDWMHTQSNDQTILLHGVSSFPAHREELHLKSVEFLRERFGLPVGFSDHSVGSLGATVAVSLGAQVIERHFFIETRGAAADIAVSMDAKQLKKHIEELRTIRQILGRGNSASAAESRTRMAVRSPLGSTIGFLPERVGQVIGSHAL